jgi:transcriptional regulator with XRE-family HTH domain
MNRQEDALRKLGRRLRQLREEQGLSIAALASLTALETKDISIMEAGQLDVPLTTIVVLARALRTTPAQLLTHLPGS